MSQLLPTHYKHGGTLNNQGRKINLPLRLREAHLLLFLFLTFSLAWCVLVVYMPETQTSDTGFEATYQKFIHRSLDSIETENKQSTLATLTGGNSNHDMGPPKIFRPPSVNQTSNSRTPRMFPSVSTGVAIKGPPQPQDSSNDQNMNSDEVNLGRKEKVKEVCYVVGLLCDRHTCFKWYMYKFLAVVNTSVEVGELKV